MSDPYKLVISPLSCDNKYVNFNLINKYFTKQ